jgi:hypothetical protein
MKRLYNLLFLATALLFGESCSTYYVAANKTPVDLFADETATETVYSIPAGTALLIKGKPRNGTAKVRYHSNKSWYYVSTQSLYLVPNANAKEYFTNYPTIENQIASSPGSSTSFYIPSSGYNPTIQTGPRGGKYYINKNGNKTYVKKSSSSGSTRRVGGSRRH